MKGILKMLPPFKEGYAWTGLHATIIEGMPKGDGSFISTRIVISDFSPFIHDHDLLELEHSKFAGKLTMRKLLIETVSKYGEDSKLSRLQHVDYDNFMEDPFRDSALSNAVTLPTPKVTVNRNLCSKKEARERKDWAQSLFLLYGDGNVNIFSTDKHRGHLVCGDPFVPPEVTDSTILRIPQFIIEMCKKGTFISLDTSPSCPIFRVHLYIGKYWVSITWEENTSYPSKGIENLIKYLSSSEDSITLSLHIDRSVIREEYEQYHIVRTSEDSAVLIGGICLEDAKGIAYSYDTHLLGEGVHEAILTLQDVYLREVLTFLEDYVCQDSASYDISIKIKMREVWLRWKDRKGMYPSELIITLEAPNQPTQMYALAAKCVLKDTQKLWEIEVVNGDKTI